MTWIDLRQPTLILVGSMAAFAQAVSGQTKRVGASLVGTVIETTTGAPVEGAVVRLAGRGFPGEQSATTDSKGVFRFSELSADVPVRLSASKAGFLSGVYGREEPQVGRLPLPGPSIVLAVSEHRTGLKIALSREGVISGQVLHAGVPLTGIDVSTVLRRDVGRHRRFVRGPMATTDQAGRYRIGGLAAGSYFVRTTSIATAAGPGRATTPVSVRRSWFYPQSASVDGAVSIELESGDQIAAIDFHLPVERGIRIVGEFESASPISAIPIRLLAAEEGLRGAGSEIAITESTADGSFSFDAVPPGRYRISVSPSVADLYDASAPVREFLTGFSVTSGRVNAEGTNVRLLTPKVPVQHYADQMFDVTVDDVDKRVRVRLKSTATLSGNVVDSTGPIEGVTLACEPTDGDPDKGAGTAARTDKLGAFRLVGVAPGSCRLRVSGTRFIRSVRVGSNELESSIPVPEAENLSGLVVTTTTESASVSGTLVAPGGSASGFPIVLLFPASVQQWNETAYRSPTQTTFPDSRGFYRFGGLPGGDYYVIALERANIAALGSASLLESLSGVAERLFLRWGEAKAVNLQVLRSSR